MVNSVCRRLAGAFLVMFLPGQLLAAPRVISLSPGNTELAFAAGITPIAVSTYSNYPPEAEGIEQVANWQGLNFERIVALKPDIVLAWRGGNPQRQVSQIEALGSKVIWLDLKSVADVEAALRQLAPFSPTPEKANQAADQLAQEFAELKARHKTSKPKKVFLQFSQQPLFTTNNDSIQNEIVSMCGGENVFANSRVPWPQVSREQVLVRKPQAIIIAGDSRKAEAVEKNWKEQLSVPVIAIDDDEFTRSGPRIILAAKQLCEALDKL
ncbi:vitamin B12 ABC transporter substrate-binding protein BtuF [Citrobacter sp. JGM124]|uniref:vitamin B12 ABC transporter substrate-binding protein BtuF n=1 Tax=Citrobacter sp. JGM124 TaxID=2799789 RepID=UPI001BABB975|nr:vitamin B12 ABC transporter substrate-binding protein BtuF [Citrobacter sp. JGM124]MBS0848533.1 vitamin B12 ABC transporter substrate-binding protein BtuF [Citrobacter sp. JGM124]